MSEIFRYRLTKSQLKALRVLKNNQDADIICDCGQAWVGDERTSYRLVYNLLRLCCLKEISSNTEKTQVYVINETGEAAIEKGYVELPFAIFTIKHF